MARPRHGPDRPGFGRVRSKIPAQKAQKMLALKPSKMLAVNCETPKKALRNSRNLATPRIRLQKTAYGRNSPDRSLYGNRREEFKVPTTTSQKPKAEAEQAPSTCSGQEQARPGIAEFDTKANAVESRMRVARPRSDSAHYCVQVRSCVKRCPNFVCETGRADS